MKALKKYFSTIGICLISLIIYFLILIVLAYTGVVKLETIIKINFIFVALIIFFFNIKNGKNASKKGYLEGLKFGSIIIFILLLLNIIFYRKVSLYILSYYGVILSSSIIGSMIGINLKR